MPVVVGRPLEGCVRFTGRKIQLQAKINKQTNRQTNCMRMGRDPGTKHGFLGKKKKACSSGKIERECHDSLVRYKNEWIRSRKNSLL